MEQIKILFFALASFFGIEDGRFAANKTTITISPNKQEIEIVQENLFTVIQSEEDSIAAVEQWDKLFYWKERGTSLSKELNSFSVKSVRFKSIKKTISPHLILGYSSENDLRAMGIWFNKNKNQFSINNISSHNVLTMQGELIGNYWVFNGGEKFSFTIEPFLEMSKKHQNLKVSLTDLIMENKKN